MGKYLHKATLFNSERTLVSSAFNAESRKPVIIKSLKAQHPNTSELTKFFHEFETLLLLEGTEGIIAPIEKATFLDLPSIVFPDLGGTVLSESSTHLVGKPLQLSSFFKVAMSITETLGRIHSRGIIHKDLNPGNMLSRTDFSQTWLIDFSISSRIKREIQHQKPVGDLEGTLHYLPPEQSGRINRSLDYRADYYSLGVCLYELLTGQHPFHREETIELLHDHVATPFPNPAHLRPEVPAALAQVIQKLASKDPDDRYQSTLGIVQDLQRCEALWKKGDLATTFALGQDDFAEVLMIPSKIYGRAPEISGLLRSFEERQTAIRPEGQLTLIAGASGLGKSALVHELLGPVAKKKGFLLEGKIDQFQRDRILYGFAAPLEKFFNFIAGESTEALGQIKDELIHRLRSNVGVLVDVFPELASYLGAQERPSSLGPKETRERLLEAVGILFQTISSRKPLVFFIDDLQWADLTTLEVMEYLTQLKLSRFMLLGAYRSNEVPETHPLSKLISRLGKSRVSIFELQPLNEESVHDLLRDALGACEELPRVTEALTRKTGGNPFFMHQLIKKLYADEILVRDPKNKAWQVKLQLLEELSVSPNVVEFLMAKLRGFSHGLQNLLTVGAALGSKFEIRFVAEALNMGTEQLISALKTAVDEEILRPVGGIYQHLLSSNRADLDSLQSGDRLTFQFLHDRIQQAAYELKSRNELKRIHFNLGQLLSRLSHKAGEEISPIEIAEQYLNGDFEALEESTLTEIANRFLAAASQAKNSSNFDRALVYVKTARGFFGDSAWQSQGRLLRQIYSELSHIAFLAGDRQESERAGQILLQKAATDFDKALAYSLLAHQARLSGKLEESLNLSLKSLESLGIKLRASTSLFSVIKELILTLRAVKKFSKSEKGYLSILDLKVSDDPRILLILKCFYAMGPPAYLTGKMNLFAVMTFAAIRLIFTHGHSEYSTVFFSFFLLILNKMGKFELARDLSESVLRLVNHPVSKNPQPSVLGYFVWTTLNSWIHFPQSDFAGHNFKLFELSLETREYSALYSAGNFLFSTAETIPLSQAMEFKSSLPRLRQAGVASAIDFFAATMNFFEWLHITDEQKKAQLLKEMEVISKNRKASGDETMWLNTSALRYCTDCHFGNWSDVRESMAELYERRVAFSAILWEVRFEFYYALAILINCRKKKRGLDLKERRTLRQIRSHLTKLVNHNAENFGRYAYLVEAEYAFYQGKPESAVRELYRKAMLATQGKTYHLETLVYELTGEYYRSIGDSEVGGFYLLKAHAVCSKWEAWGKTAYLERAYPEYFLEENLKKIIDPILSTVQPGLPGMILGGSHRAGSGTLVPTTQSGSSSLDFEEVLKAARSLSGEVVLHKLTERLLSIVSNVSGAVNGALLLLDQGGRLFIHSSFSNRPEDKVNSGSREVPMGLLSRVQAKLEPVIVADASKEADLISESYFEGKTVRSLLCLPTVHQGKLLAMLYLENNEVVGAFTPDRLKTLNVLASQAAVSIENAALYETLEEKVKDRTKKLAEKNRDMQVMLKNMPQGLFSVYSNKGAVKDRKISGVQIHPEYSAYLETILGESELAGKDPLAFLLNHPDLGSDAKSSIITALSLSLDDTIGFDLNGHLLPTELVRRDTLGKDQYLELDWRPIVNSDDITERVLVTLRDVTELRALRAESAKQKAELEMIGEILECGIADFRQDYEVSCRYLEECRRLLGAAKSGGRFDQDVLNHLFRNLHTIKGNSRTLGLSHAVNVVHDSEQYLDELRSGPSPRNPDFGKMQSDIERIQSALDRYRRVVDDKLGGSVNSDLEPGVVRFQKMVSRFLEVNSSLALTHAEKELAYDKVIDLYRSSIEFLPIEEALRAELKAVAELAKALGKEEPRVVILTASERGLRYLVSRSKVGVLKDVINHCLRNSLDHGLEFPAERMRSGKPPAGTVRLILRPSDLGAEYFDLILSDDGKGLNLGALKSKGVRSGLCRENSSDFEIADVIFASGVSTAEQVTQVSGRGVGMDAVKALIEQSGGKLKVNFTGERSSNGFRAFELVLSLPREWFCEERGEVAAAAY